MELENFDSSEISLRGNLRHEATSSLKKGEPSSASKTVKIAHQQKCGLLLSNCCCLVFELLLSDLSLDFNYIWSYRILIQARLVSLES